MIADSIAGGSPPPDPAVALGAAMHAAGPLLVVLCGPSGAGKDALRVELQQRHPEMFFALSATTRAPRGDEQTGVDYDFIDETAFRALIKANDLIEWELFRERYYGTPLSPVARALADGRDVLMRKDVRGAISIKQRIPAAVTIFIYPPSIDALRERMRRRGSETPDSLERRIEIAVSELALASQCDYAVLNADGGLERTVATAEAIMAAERCRVGRGPVVLSPSG